jgi:hypothetical protein
MNGVYSDYNWLLQQRILVHNSNSWSWIWKIVAPEKIKFFIWSVCHHAIPTLSLLRRRNLVQSDICPRCSTSEETIFTLHLHRRFSYCVSIRVGIKLLFFLAGYFGGIGEPEIWFEFVIKLFNNSELLLNRINLPPLLVVVFILGLLSIIPLDRFSGTLVGLIAWF